MKLDKLFQLHTLFNPFSEEWPKTNYTEKKEMLEQINKTDYFEKLPKNMLYFQFDFEVRKLEKQGDSDFIEIPPIPTFNFLIASGLYLNRSFSIEASFPLNIKEIKKLVEKLESLTDGRKKKNKELSLFMIQKVNGTRDLFDFPSAEGESSDIPTKRKKIQKIIDGGYTPLEILYLHYCDYNSRDRRQDIAREAPNSAFALCWNGDKLYSPLTN